VGTDIHALIEFDRSTAERPFSDGREIVPYNTATLRIPRNYAIFNALAGARDAIVAGIAAPCPIPPRGLPRPLSDVVEANFYLWVVPDIDPALAAASDCLESPLPLIRTSDVERLGLRTERVPTRRLDRAAAGITAERAPNPDFHSTSWLFRDEIVRCLELCSIQPSSVSLPFRATLSVLSQFEHELGKHRARMVFWFDG